MPVNNYDFWWHLATGKYIVETKSLLQDDPFSYTSHDTPSERKEVILKGYWLAQVIYYKVYNLWDLKGIIISRSLLFLFFLLFVFLSIKKQNSSDLVALILVSGVFWFSKNVAWERPQAFTFLVFSLVFYLLEDFRINRSKKVFFIPLLVLLFSNMHPGYIICIMLITLYIAGEGLRCFIRKDYKDSMLKGLLIIWGLTIVFSMFNPNFLTVLTSIFSIHGEYIRGNTAYMSPFYLYAKKFMPLHYSYVIFLAFSLLGMRYLKKIGPVHILLLLVFSIMSFIAIRYVIFYMFIAAPIIARIIINLKEERAFETLVRILKAGENFLYLIVCIIGIIFVFNSIPSFAGHDFREDTAYTTPKGAADFLSNLKIKGNMFNEFAFGGYLIWRLYPDKKVFIDGRILKADVLNEYNIAAGAIEGSGLSWEDIIKKYNVSYVLTSPLRPYGLIFPIVEKLLEKDEWVLIYSDHLSLIFLRNDSENMSVIKKYAKDKGDVYNTIITQASARAMKNRVNPNYLITLGKVFFKTGKMNDAEKSFLMAYERDPNNLLIKDWLQKFEENKKIDSVKDNPR